MLMGRGELTSPPHLKGRPPLRQCPDDFDVIFVEQGRVGCEAWYRARRDTVTRWLVERGKDKLIRARAAYVAHQRANGQWITRSTKLIEHHEIKRPSIRESIRDRRKVSIIVARHAAQHLRIRRHGGMIVSPAGDGEWWVGTKRLSAAQMLDLAKSRGFDDAVIVLTSGDDEPRDIQTKPLGARSGDGRTRAEWMEQWAERFRGQRSQADLRIGSNWQDDDEVILPGLQDDTDDGVKS